VASTIAERTGNGYGLTGLAYNATIMPVRVLDDAGEGDAADIARGVRFAASRGADVINLSLEFGTDVRAAEIPELLDAIRYAHGRGAVVVGASGNDGSAALAYPARATDVLSVGSTTEHGCLSAFSNTGSGLDLVAPGGGEDAPLADDRCAPGQARGPRHLAGDAHGQGQAPLGSPARTRARRWPRRTSRRWPRWRSPPASSGAARRPRRSSATSNAPRATSGRPAATRATARACWTRAAAVRPPAAPAAPTASG
jgi:hypothetical protein